MPWFYRSKQDKIQTLIAQFAEIPIARETFDQRNALVERLADYGVYQNALVTGSKRMARYLA